MAQSYDDWLIDQADRHADPEAYETEYEPDPDLERDFAIENAMMEED